MSKVIRNGHNEGPHGTPDVSPDAKEGAEPLMTARQSQESVHAESRTELVIETTYNIAG